MAAWRKDGSQLTADDDSSSWTIRIIPNKYPSLSEEPGKLSCGPYDCVEQDGIQELVIPTPRHVTSISELSIQELGDCLKATQFRMQTLRQRTALKHLMWFMNCRMAAGASLGHIHFQLMGSPIVSPVMQARMQRNARNFRERGENLMTTLLNWECQQEARIVKVSENFVMLCPFASRFSFQVWIIPQSTVAVLLQSAGLQPGTVGALSVLHQEAGTVVGPTGLQSAIAPGSRSSIRTGSLVHRDFSRLNRMAGYEIGTDIWVNPVPPEMAAKRLLS